MKVNTEWRTKGRPQTVKATRKLATEFAQMEAAPGDRPLSDRRMDLYESLTQAKQFRNVDWARGYCKETRKTYRLNGKHTSTMLAGWEGPLPDIYAVITDYECDTLAAVAELYATFDSKDTVRGAGDINRMFASAVPELGRIKNHIVNRLVAGINYKPTKGKWAEKTLAERAEVLLTEYPFVLWVNDEILEGIEYDSKNKQRMLLRSPALGAMFETYKKDQVDALKFWREVRDAADPVETSPTRRLERYLRSATLTHQRVKTARAGAVIADGREMWTKCTLAWNAWRKNKPTELRYYPAAKQEIVIE